MDDVSMLRMAYLFAHMRSTDPGTQNGAIIVTRNMRQIAGANHFAHGVAENEQRWQRPLKNKYVEHAERNAIYACAREGVATTGATMYCPWFACCDCARAIIQAGIQEVVGHDFAPHADVWHWLEEIAIADEMLREAGVKFRRIKATIGGVSIRFNGQIVEP